MAIDLAAIRKRMAQLSGTPKFWKPEIGEYRIRVLPWNEADSLPEGDMFPTLWFYNLGEGKDWQQIATPKQFGLPDPIDDLLTTLWKGDEDDKAIAKKLRASGQTYVPFVDRGNMARGTQVWKLPGGRDGMALHQKLLGYFVNAEILEEVDNWIDPAKGFDLVVTVTDSGKVYMNKKMLKIDFEIARKPTKLAATPEETAKILSGRPSLKDYYTLESAESIEGKLKKWLDTAPAAPAASTDTTEGSSRGESASKTDAALDEIAESVVPQKAAKAATKAKKGAEAEMASLDAAMADLES